ncbi:protein O4 [Cercopithecine betaherpesvirus 5]|uniref:Protein O4 n=1 Tax=Simian cytomegalovirus (strain Colburn) TaxID=50292 RepID=G8XT69_SCMVC|nr:protein O4 [Cercopithecine betaherpesvirus 5]AEV80361.1 protein O4 [Cercopithecine betaherpesvirus 5]
MSSKNNHIAISDISMSACYVIFIPLGIVLIILELLCIMKLCRKMCNRCYCKVALNNTI